MDQVKSVFSIKDLENISGIKAHTIRIWEKRYNVLEPMRTDTNIRVYDIENLQKLLNITLLHNHGYKISRISAMPPEKIPQMVREIISEKSVKHHAISSFKLAMMNFDHSLFFNTYNSLLDQKSFREVFFEVFVPLMNEIGLLWQSETITPAHEHFISYLIKQKVMSHTEKVQLIPPSRHDRVFVLYLPMNEVHELGLMYLNYELLVQGYKTIYLGESVPMDNLKDVKRYFDHITFVSYFTVKPEPDDMQSYLEAFDQEIADDDTDLWVLGYNTQHIDVKRKPDSVRVFQSIPDIVSAF